MSVHGRPAGTTGSVAAKLSPVPDPPAAITADAGTLDGQVPRVSAGNKFDKLGDQDARGYPISVAIAGTAPRPASARPARPGRKVLVAADLADLRGPAEGVIELPLRLFWSATDRTFDLSDPALLRSMYEKVLREAIRMDELTTYLNSGRLTVVWPDLFLPKDVRQAWEHQHPSLRRAAAA